MLAKNQLVDLLTDDDKAVWLWQHVDSNPPGQAGQSDIRQWQYGCRLWTSALHLLLRSSTSVLWTSADQQLANKWFGLSSLTRIT